MVSGMVSNSRAGWSPSEWRQKTREKKSRSLFRQLPDNLVTRPCVRRLLFPSSSTGLAVQKTRRSRTYERHLHVPDMLWLLCKKLVAVKLLLTLWRSSLQRRRIEKYGQSVIVDAENLGVDSGDEIERDSTAPN